MKTLLTIFFSGVVGFFYGVYVSATPDSSVVHIISVIKGIVESLS